MPSIKKKKKKQFKIRFADIKKVATLNIGTILFGALFIYMIVSVMMYLTATRITSYQVTSGPLSRNQTYTALALRSEEIVESSTSGYVTYYARENSKVKKQAAIYGVGSGESTDTILSLTDEQLADVRSSIAKFAHGYDSDSFYDTYNFKYELEGSLISDYIDSSIYQPEPTTSIEDDIVAPQTVGTDTINFSPVDGVIQFTRDGYEDVTDENISLEDFNQKSYEKKNLRKEYVDVGDEVYKVITSEKWSLMLPLTDAQVVSLAGRDSIRVKFQKDSVTQTGRFSLLTREDGYYGKITFTSGMSRYAADRFLQIELVTNTRTGLKIPLSAIVNKDFYVIPAGYETTGGTADETGFLVETKSKDDGSSSEFVNVTVYAQQEDYYYVDCSEFSEGDVIIKPDSTERYTIKDKKPLEGVYCINKGYAVFRKVSIIDQNEEYCIVETGTDYGIAQFDNIVYDSSTVKEEEILY